MGEGRRPLGLDIDDPDTTVADVAEQAPQGGHVEDVLKAFAHGLEDDREIGETCGHLQQVRGPLALLPQRAATAGASARQEQGARRALAEASGEQRRPADLALDDAGDLLGIDSDEVGDGSRCRVVHGVGQAQDDSVIGVHDLSRDGVLRLEARTECQTPGCVHASTERRVDGHAPVAELVAEALDDDGAVIGKDARRGPLLGEVGDEVVRRPCVKAAGLESASQGVGIGAGAQELPERASELDRAADRVSVPERKPGDLAGRGGDENAIRGDLLDSPRAGAEREDIADTRLVDHLLVELAHAVAGADEHDRVEPAVRNRAAADDREALCAGPGADDVAVAVPHDARAQFREVVARVLAGEHVEHGVEHAGRQVGVGGGTADGREELVDRPVVHRDHGDDLLGEHVEGIARHGEGLDGTGLHALHHDGALQEVAAELGEDDAATDRAHLVARSADALQSARHARRRLDLDHEVDGAHVDAELQAGCRHDGGQPTALEVVLDDRALLAAH